MPTDKPRFSIVVSDELYDRINDFRFDRRIKSQSKAVNELILLGLESLSGNMVTIGPTLSKGQMETIEKYNRLDEHGRVVIDFILEKEYERCIAKTPTEEELPELHNNKDAAPQAAEDTMSDFVNNDLPQSKVGE